MTRLPNLTSLTLDSERLRLLSISDAYIDAIFTEFTPDVATYMYPRPADQRADSEAFVHWAERENKEGKSLHTVITLRDTGEFLGCVGLHDLLAPRPEFGIWVKGSAHMHGYGREAIRTLKRWADEHLAYEYLIYPVDSRNISSRKIPESLGAAIISQFDGTGGMGQELTLIKYRIER
ncbi:GNAT family N-acetyltransferase [Fibrella sp. HMF5335]|uniref:GNAT family N-acetyltransferase n=1 Tax=Fibrella rubiginis TaxID=2817060 RepID=A0A939GJS3_9BACT|nr:GNAT family N-acetyltransferase [Fibrella rubiginis]MBO0939103.1 GNAT family N-acetyltransferase [Fibrella rubiginis]